MSTAYDLVFPRFRPPSEAARFDTSAARVTWLGTAAHVVSTATTTVLVDPYVSRHRLGQVLATRLAPDEGAIDRWIPEKVDAILCGHSHYDHLLDAPRIAKRTGATLVGSATTCAFARAEGVPVEKLVAVPPSGARVSFGDVAVRFVPSKHGRIALGRVPFPGEVRAPPRLPARASAYKMGGAFGIVMNAAGVRIYHNGSADLVDSELEGERADVLLVGLAGRKGTPRYLERLLGALTPSVVVPTHHDAFFAPLEAGVHLLPGIDLDGFASAVRTHAPRAQIAWRTYGEPV